MSRPVYPRRQCPQPDPPFLAEEMRSLCDNHNFQWFCKSAFLVDEYEPVTVSGAPSLAFATHLLSVLEPLESATNVAGDDDVCVQFRTLDDGNASDTVCNARYGVADRDHERSRLTLARPA